MKRNAINYAELDGDFKKDIRAFVGPHFDKFDQRWTKMSHRKSRMISWNWPAFLVVGLWSGYRQHLMWAWTYVGIYFVLSLFYLHVPDGSVPLTTQITLSGFYALFSNYMYLDYVVRKVEILRQTCPDPDTRQGLLAKDGGVRWSKFWLVLVVILAVSAILSFL